MSYAPDYSAQSTSGVVGSGFYRSKVAVYVVAGAFTMSKDHRSRGFRMYRNEAVARRFWVAVERDSWM